MTTFDERERAFEAKFARDQEMLFKIQARRDKLLAAWAAERLGLSQAEADGYARDLVHTDFEHGGEQDVLKKLLGDLTASGVEIDEAEIQAQIELKTVEARRQFIESLDL
jgi:hypothetical protein